MSNLIAIDQHTYVVEIAIDAIYHLPSAIWSSGLTNHHGRHKRPNEPIIAHSKSTPVRAMDSFVYKVSCNMIGRAKTKTRKFGLKGLGRPIPCAHKQPTLR